MDGIDGHLSSDPGGPGNRRIFPGLDLDGLWWQYALGLVEITHHPGRTHGRNYMVHHTPETDGQAGVLTTSQATSAAKEKQNRDRSDSVAAHSFRCAQTTR